MLSPWHLTANILVQAERKKERFKQVLIYAIVCWFVLDLLVNNITDNSLILSTKSFPIWYHSWQLLATDEYVILADNHLLQIKFEFSFLNVRTFPNLLLLPIGHWFLLHQASRSFYSIIFKFVKDYSSVHF